MDDQWHRRLWVSDSSPSNPAWPCLASTFVATAVTTATFATTAVTATVPTAARRVVEVGEAEVALDQWVKAGRLGNFATDAP